MQPTVVARRHGGLGGAAAAGGGGVAGGPACGQAGGAGCSSPAVWRAERSGAHGLQRRMLKCPCCSGPLGRGCARKCVRHARQPTWRNSLMWCRALVEQDGACPLCCVVRGCTVTLGTGKPYGLDVADASCIDPGFSHHGPQLAALVERCAATETAAARAEQVASAAMAAAEGAVRDEMEAAAVAKETASALDKALTDLQVRRRAGCWRLLCG